MVKNEKVKESKNKCVICLGEAKFDILGRRLETWAADSPRFARASIALRFHVLCTRISNIKSIVNPQLLEFSYDHSVIISLRKLRTRALNLQCSAN